MKKQRINSLNFNKFIKSIDKSHDNGNYVFKGVSSENQVIPRLFSNFSSQNENKKYSERTIYKYEKQLLLNYHNVLSTNIKIFNNEPKNFLDWLAFAQHYSLTTRLLDWSFNPYKALYFAASCNYLKPENDFYLLVMNLDKHLYEDFSNTKFQSYDILNNNFGDFYLEYKTFIDDTQKNLGFSKVDENTDLGSLDNHTLGELDFIELDDCDNMNYFEELNLKNNNKKSNMYFFTGLHSNPRIKAQEGLFQIPFAFGAYENYSNIKTEILKKCEKIYIIKKDLADKICDLLNQKQITKESMGFEDSNNDFNNEFKKISNETKIK